MKTLLLTLCLLAGSCVSDPVDVSLSYLAADGDSYKALYPSVEALLEMEASRALDSRALSPATSEPFSDAELGSLQIVMDSWGLRLAGAGFPVEVK